MALQIIVLAIPGQPGGWPLHVILLLRLFRMWRVVKFVEVRCPQHCMQPELDCALSSGMPAEACSLQIVAHSLPEGRLHPGSEVQ